MKVSPISDHEETKTRLILHTEMSNEAAVIAAKDTEVLLLLIHALGQFKYFLFPWYIVT